MKTLRDLEAFIEATAAPVVVGFASATNTWIVRSRRILDTEFTGESLEVACQRMADYFEESTGKHHA